MFKPREKERTRFEEIENNPELKIELGLTNAKSYVAYFDENYEHVGAATVQNWINKRKKTIRKSKDSSFDIREAFIKDQKKIWDAFMVAVGKKQINAQLFRTFAQLADQLVEKKEVNIDFAPTDRIKLATELRDWLIQQYKDTGMCEICHRPQILRHEICLDTKSKFSEDREVGTLELSTRPN